jgi:hypothetical protein
MTTDELLNLDLDLVEIGKKIDAWQNSGKPLYNFAAGGFVRIMREIRIIRVALHDKYMSEMRSEPMPDVCQEEDV